MLHGLSVLAGEHSAFIVSSAAAPSDPANSRTIATCVRCSLHWCSANVAFFGWAHWVDTSEMATRTRAGKAGTRRCPSHRTCTSRSQPRSAAVRWAHLPLRPLRKVPPRRCERAVSQRTIAASSAASRMDIGSTSAISAVRPISTALARLEKGGITDAGLMSDAEDAGRISVGIFSEQARAVRRAEQVRTLGFKPILDLHQRMQRAFWLDMELHRDQPEPPVTALESATGQAAGRDERQGYRLQRLSARRQARLIEFRRRHGWCRPARFAAFCCRLSSVVEQRFCKPLVGGSNPSAGTTPKLMSGRLAHERALHFKT